MTVRIIVTESDRERVVRVDGRLTRAELGELELAIGEDLDAVRLLLEDLRSADAAGLAALRRFHALGVELCAVPPYIACHLEDEGH